MQHPIKPTEWEDRREQSNTPLHSFIGPPAQSKRVSLEHELSRTDRCLQCQDRYPDDEESDMRECADVFNRG